MVPEMKSYQELGMGKYMSLEDQNSKGENTWLCLSAARSCCDNHSTRLHTWCKSVVFVQFILLEFFCASVDGTFSGR